jgi:hypothetical protein
MDVREPQKRRRGFFLHSDTDEPDTGEYESAEGVATRSRITRSENPRHFSSSRRNESESDLPGIDESRREIRSGNATGSHQRAHLPR